jgi:hypothetical protein
MSGLSNKINLEIFLEEFFEHVKYMGGEPKEIYVNPTFSEIDDVAEVVKPHIGGGANDPEGAWMKYQNKENKYARFTALPNKKVYVFSPWIMHEDLDRKFGVRPEDVYIHGITTKKEGKWICVEAHNIEFMLKHLHGDEGNVMMRELKNFAKVDWGWLDRYIVTTPLLQKFNPQIRKALG